jgi:hypothetical protein
MTDPKNYRFIQPPNWTMGLPVTWQGWLWLIGVFALEIVVTRELQGVARMIAFLAVAFGFFLLARGRTQVVSRDSYLANRRGE